MWEKSDTTLRPGRLPGPRDRKGHHRELQEVSEASYSPRSNKQTDKLSKTSKQTSKLIDYANPKKNVGKGFVAKCELSLKKYPLLFIRF